MADSGTARSVSGEMMAARHGVAPDAATQGRGMPRVGWAAEDVIEADYVEVMPEPQDRPSRAPELSAETAKPTGLAFLQQGDGRSTTARRGGPLFWMAGAIAIVAAFWISGGHSAFGPSLVAAMSQPDAQLRIDNVRSQTRTVEGEDALLVDGEIRNEGGESGRVPALAVTVQSLGGETAVYRLGTLRTPLGPGAKYSFSGRLIMPKDGVKTVSVAFDD